MEAQTHWNFQHYKAQNYLAHKYFRFSVIVEILCCHFRFSVLFLADVYPFSSLGRQTRSRFSLSFSCKTLLKVAEATNLHYYELFQWFNRLVQNVISLLKATFINWFVPEYKGFQFFTLLYLSSSAAVWTVKSRKHTWISFMQCPTFKCFYWSEFTC